MKKRPHIGLYDFFFFHFFPYSLFLFVFLLFVRPLPLHEFVETKRNPEDVAGCPTMGVPMSWYFEALRNPFPLFRTMLLPLLPRFVSWFQGRPGGGDTEGPVVVPRNQSLSFFFFFHSFPFSLSPSIRRHIETLSRRHFEIERSRGSQKFKMDGNWLPGVKRTWQYHDCTTIIRVEQVLKY